MVPWIVLFVICLSQCHLGAVLGQYDNGLLSSNFEQEEDHNQQASTVSSLRGRQLGNTEDKLTHQLPSFESAASALQCNPFHHNPKEVTEAVEAAKKSLEKFPTDVPLASRIPVMILFSKGFATSSHMTNRLEYLRCALLKLQRNIMPHTTLDIFIWGLNTTAHPLVIPAWFNDKDFPRVHIMALPEAVWRIPCGLMDDRDWTLRKHFDVDYYLMGRWRLTFSFDFARAMGYEYHLQFDDDAMVNSDITFNITERMDAQKYNTALFSDVIYEIPAATLGLSELTSYWLRINHYTPRGPIYKHTTPANLQGLNSDGYHRAYSPGYFMLFRVSWWFSPHVQDFLRMILRSGRDVEGRWQEQAVMNMMIYIFIAEPEIWVIKELDLGHDRHKRANFENWCIKTGLISG